MKSILGIVLIILGVAGMCVGTSLVSGGKPSGWAALVAGGASTASAYVLMRPARSVHSVADETSSSSSASTKEKVT